MNRVRSTQARSRSMFGSSAVRAGESASGCRDPRCRWRCLLQPSARRRLLQSGAPRQWRPRRRSRRINRCHQHPGVRMARPSEDLGPGPCSTIRPKVHRRPCVSGRGLSPRVETSSIETGSSAMIALRPSTRVLASWVGIRLRTLPARPPDGWGSPGGPHLLWRRQSSHRIDRTP